MARRKGMKQVGGSGQNLSHCGQGSILYLWERVKVSGVVATSKESKLRKAQVVFHEGRALQWQKIATKSRNAAKGYGTAGGG